MSCFRNAATALMILAGSVASWAVPVRAQGPIGVSYQPSVLWALPMYLATVNGWWRQAGLDEVVFSLWPSGPPQVLAAATGGWDVGGMGSEPAILGASGLDILTISVTPNLSPANAIMVQENKFAAIKANPQLLKTQRLLVTANSTADYTMRRCLLKLGVPLQEVQFVNQGQAEIVAAMLTRQADVAGVWAPNTYVLEERIGAKYLCTGADLGLAVPGAIVVRGAFARERPKDVARFLAVYLRGWSWAKANPAAARSQARDFYRRGGYEISAQAMDREFALQTGYSLAEILGLMARGPSESTVDRWFSDIGSFIAGSGTIPINPDVKTYITDDFLKQVAADPVLNAFATAFDHAPSSRSQSQHNRISK